MTRVTGKLQITLPKRLAQAFGIRVGDEVELVASGRHIAILPPGSVPQTVPVEDRLREFDQATERQRQREQRDARTMAEPGQGRGWTREGLYDRNRAG